MSKAVIGALLERFPDAVTDAYEGVGGDDCAFVKKERIVEVCRYLRETERFDLAPVRDRGGLPRHRAPLRGGLQPALHPPEHRACACG